MDEEIKQLEKLLDEEKNEEALRMAEELFKDYTNTPRKLLAVQCAFLRAKGCLGKLDEALAAGSGAIELAKDLGEWDYYGVASHFLGATHGMLKQYAAAIKQYRDFLDHGHLYTWASRFTAVAWYNLAIAYGYEGHYNRVTGCLRRALEAAEASGDQREAHGIRQCLAEQYIRADERRMVPRLLAKCGKFLRDHPDTQSFLASRMWHLQLRIKFASQTGRVYRARVLAMRGIIESGMDFYHSRTFHSILATGALNAGIPAEALKHAVAAQVYSGYVNRKDWEEEAADLVREIALVLRIPVPDVERDYLDTVVFEEV